MDRVRTTALSTNGKMRTKHYAATPPTPQTLPNADESRLRLTAEQTKAFRGLLAGLRTRPVQTLDGPAGAGKSEVLCCLTGERADLCICAPTNKGAAVLRERGFVGATTVHRAIYDTRFEGGRFVSQRKAREGLGFGGFLVDEASMIDLGTKNDLLSFGLPVVFVLDGNQLPPPGRPPGLVPPFDHVLTEVHRNAGEIADFAVHLLRGRPARDFPASGSRVRLLRPRDVTDQLLAGADLIITAKHGTRVRLNRRVREFKGYEGSLAVGDRVVCRRSDPRSGLCTGDQGEVVGLAGVERPRLDLDCQGTLRRGIAYDPAAFGRETDPPFAPGKLPFDYAYATTCHRAQGGEWEGVLVYEPWVGGQIEARWAYTAATRAKRRLWWVTEGR